MKILVINGPNLNFLGIREPEIYGDSTYKDLCNLIKKKSKQDNVKVDFFQSNHEGKIVDKIQKAYYKKYDGIIINPAGYTHTSVAILDALKAVNIPCVEVHISDINGREEFRKHSYISLVAKRTIKGLGFYGYIEALTFLENYINNQN
jgi:3-dehydroquinate dehydratase-2